MSKGLKRAITLVGVAALVVTGVGLFVAAPLVGGVGAAVGVSLGTVAGLPVTLGLIGAAGIAALSIGSMPDPPSIDETGANARGAPAFDAGAFGAFVFGTTTVPLQLVYEEQSGSSPDRVVHDIYAHAWHRIQSFVSLSVGTDEGVETVSFSGNDGTGDYSNLVWWFRATGGQTTALSGTPFNNNAWPSSAVFRGMAHSAIVWNVDDEAFTSKFSGLPTRMDIVVQGAWLYDPRDDDAYGSGVQDFDTPGTWLFNNGNAVLVLLRFLIGEYSPSGDLIWGRGARETDIDMDTFVAMADVCDETVDGKPRYRLGGMHFLDGSFQGFVAQWEHETGGKLSKAGGKYRVWIPHDDLVPLTTITDNDLLAGQSIQHVMAGSINTLYNTSRGRYIDPDQGYRGFPYPEVSEASAVIEDGNRKRVMTQDFSWVQDVEIAQRTARLKIRRSRFQRMWTVPIGWKGQSPNYRPFTVHTLNCAETNFDDQLVRVVDRRMAFNGVTVLVLQQEDVSLYDDTVPLLDPHAANTIPTRVDRSATVAPRYIDDGTVVRRTDVYTETDAGPVVAAGTYLDFIASVPITVRAGDEVVIQASCRASTSVGGITTTLSPAREDGPGFSSVQGITKNTTASEVIAVNGVLTGMAAGTYEFGLLSFVTAGETVTYSQIALTVIHRRV